MLFGAGGDSASARALDIVSQFALIFSLVVFIISIIALALISQKTLIDLILINILVALVIAYLTFLIGINETQHEARCTAVAVLLHYFFLAAFFWMLMIGVAIYRQFVVTLFITENTSGRQRIALRWYTTCAWLLPLIIVLCCLSRLEHYGTEEYCFIDSDSPLIWAFYAPLALILTINLYLLFETISRCVGVIQSHRRLTSHSISTNLADGENKKISVRASVSLASLLGITWIFGFIVTINGSEVVQYLFALSAILFACAVFFFHVFRNPRVRDLWRLFRQEGLSSVFSSRRTDSTALYSDDAPISSDERPVASPAWKPVDGTNMDDTHV